MDLTSEKCFEICQTFLDYTEWKALEFKDFKIEAVVGGLSNKLYKCSLPPNTAKDEKTPEAVLLRQYGQLILDSPARLTMDTLIFGLLAERGIGPKLYGSFPEGRLEEFVSNSHPITTAEMRQPQYYKACASIFADFHTLQMPLSKKKGWWDGLAVDFWDQIKSNLAVHDSDPEKKALFKEYLSFDPELQISDLRKILDEIDSPLVFCHNDLREGNALIIGKDTANWKLLPLDYEFCAYNHRAHDMANFFCEWTTDYMYKEHPFFKHDLIDYPTTDQQTEFIKAYLEAFPNCHISDEQHILKEIEHFALESHFLAGIWGVLQSTIASSIEFGYLEYGLARTKSYLYLKQKLLDKYKYTL